MGIQTMGSQHKSHLLPLLPTGTTTQTSFYTLTLDEIQTHLSPDLGKPLASMSLEELLNNVQNAAVASSSSFRLEPTVSASMSKKTVDQLWKDMQMMDKDQQEREICLGEMTLEDFLVKAGAVSQGSSDQINANIPLTQQQNQWLQYQLPSIQQQHNQNPPQHNMMSVFVPGRVVTQPLPMVANPHVEVTYPENQISMPSSLMGNLSDPQKPGCKRGAIGDGTEKTTERKQKRMIKNRESAARSRAKKQAYTTDLEIKVLLLEEENERLKKKQEVKKMLQCAAAPEPKFQLRRTSSSNF